MKKYHKKINPKLKKFIPVAKIIVETFGKNCEALIHDFSDSKHSIIAIEGEVTGRKIGDPITDFALSIWHNGGYGKKKKDIVTNYKAKTKDGKILKSSTLLIRDNQEKIIGCLCINFDLTEYLMFNKIIERFCTLIDLDQTGTKKEVENFVNNVDVILDEIISQSIEKIDKPVSMMQKNDKLRVVKLVEERGGFLIKGAYNRLAVEIGVSRYTIYNYIDELLAESKRKQL